MKLCHAPTGGETEFNRFFKGGEFLPFYIPRDFMPQIDEQDYPALICFLQQKGVSVVTKMVSPRALRAHQRVDFHLWSPWIIAHSINRVWLAQMLSSWTETTDGWHMWSDE